MNTTRWIVWIGASTLLACGSGGSNESSSEGAGTGSSSSGGSASGGGTSTAGGTGGTVASGGTTGSGSAVGSGGVVGSGGIGVAPGDSPCREILSETQFDELFPPAANDETGYPGRNPIYTYEGLMQAAAYYPKFCGEGTVDDRKREIAAFFGNTVEETWSL